MKEALDRISSSIRVSLQSDLQPIVDKIYNSVIGKGDKDNKKKTDNKLKFDNGMKAKIKSDGVEILPQDPALRSFGYQGGFMLNFKVDLN